jgi:hypothetical protein
MTIPIGLRVVALAWGLFECSGFLFAAGNPLGSVFAMYAFLPTLALLVCGLVPNTWSARRPIKIALLVILIAAIPSRLHSTGRELMDAYWVAAFMHAASLALLIVLAIWLLKAPKGHARRNSELSG